MPRPTPYYKPTRFPNGIEVGTAYSTFGGDKVVLTKQVTVTVVDGAASGTFSMPEGSTISSIGIETPTTIPGTPTNTNVRIGSSANGQQYVADVDAKAQGWIASTLLYAARNPAATVYYTVASSGGTAASQDGIIHLHVNYFV